MAFRAPVLRGRPFEKAVFPRQCDVLKTALALEHALAGLGPDVGHGAEESQPAREAIHGVPRIGFGGHRPEVPVHALEGSLPVLLPTVVRVETSGLELVLAHHDPIVDRLGLNGHAQRREQNEKQECLHGGSKFMVNIQEEQYSERTSLVRITLPPE